MGFLFGGDDSAPAPAPAVPAADPTAAEDLAKEQTKNAAMRRKLYGETVLTGSGGSLLEEEDTAAKTLLGS